MNVTHFSGLNKPSGLFQAFQNLAGISSASGDTPIEADAPDTFENTNPPAQEAPASETTEKPTFFSKLKSWGKRILMVITAFAAIKTLWNKFFGKATPATEPAPTAG